MRNTLLFTLLALLSFSTCFSLKGVDVENPTVNFTPSFLPGGSKDTISCERIHVTGKSRTKLKSYANSYRVTLVPSVVIPERLHSKIQICFHKNASLGPCQCKKDNWRSVQNGLWNSVMSPYEDKYLDVKFSGEILGPVRVTVEEDFQQWRIVCLAVGFMLQLLAPIVSSWVPFYYSSSMAIGVFLVVIIILFQGMKLLPTGRKNFLYLSIYTSVFGAGSYLLHQFSIIVNSILLNFGFSEEMHNPVSVLVGLLIALSGASLGYWLVRKFVISEDGSVDSGVAQFVKWAMRLIGFTFVFQSTLDTALAFTAQSIYLVICFAFTRGFISFHGTTKIWNIFRRILKSIGLVSPPSARTKSQQEFYSSFHKTPNRKTFSKQEWDDFTKESTRQALADWASSPEFIDWIFSNADRVKVLPDECSDESLGSWSDSTDEAAV